MELVRRFESKLNQARGKSASPSDEKKVVIVTEADEDDEEDEAAESASSSSEDGEELEPLTAKVVEQIEDGFEELAVENDIAENDAI